MCSTASPTRRLSNASERFNGRDGPPGYDPTPGRSPIRDIPLIRFNDIKLGTERRYLVKNLFPRVGMSVVWGPPKCGKSFWAFDVVMHVAIAREYRGRRVHPGSVVYCAFEGASGIEARKAAWSKTASATSARTRCRSICSRSRSIWRAIIPR